MTFFEKLIGVYTTQTSMLVKGLFSHIYIAGISVLIASIVCIPLGIYLTRHKKAANFAIGVVSVIYTIPSMAMFGLLLPIMGIGPKPAIVAITLYAMLPILRNVYTGIIGVDGTLIDAARGMGMKDMQILTTVELPLALPVIMAGLRTAATMAVSTTTTACLIGAGGLGNVIYRGVNLLRDEYTVAGAIPTALLALGVDRLLRWAENRLASRTERQAKKIEKQLQKKAN